MAKFAELQDSGWTFEPGRAPGGSMDTWASHLTDDLFVAYSMPMGTRGTFPPGV